MIKNLLVSLFAVFLFALGAAGSWYFLQYQEQQKQLAEGDHPVEEEHASESAPDEATTTTTTSTAGHGNSHADAHGAGHSKENHGSDALTVSPVAGRSMTPEEIVRYGFQYKKNMEVLKQKNEELKNNEMRLQLIQKDVDQKKMEIEGMLKQLQQTATATELLLQQTQQERQSLVNEKETLEQEKRAFSTERESLNKQLEDSKRGKPDGAAGASSPPGSNQASTADEQANLEKVALILSGMDEAAAAQTLQILANKGNVEYALQILDKIEPRNVAGILDALKDPELVSQLTEAYRGLKRQEPPKRR